MQTRLQHDEGLRLIIVSAQIDINSNRGGGGKHFNCQKGVRGCVCGGGAGKVDC